MSRRAPMTEGAGAFMPLNATFQSGWPLGPGLSQSVLRSASRQRRWTTKAGSKLAAILLAASATLVLAASSAARWDRVPAKDHARVNPFAGHPEAVTAGAILYRDHCQQCHQAGAMGDGRKKPSLKSERIRSATDGDLEWFLRQGDLGHGMPSWSSLPEAQRWQIITYLRSLQ